MLRRPANLPNPLVGLLPSRLDEVDQHPLQIPSGGLRVQAGPAKLKHGVQKFAINVELKLLAGRIADPHRPAPFVAGQPIEREFRQTPLPLHSVSDLQFVRAAGHGPQQPFAPGRRLLGVAGRDQGEQRHRRVAQPAIAIVPVAAAAELLGQRGGRRGDDPAGRRIGQRLQGDERADHRLAPRPPIGRMTDPIEPPPLRLVEHFQGIAGRRRIAMRLEPSQREGDASTFGHLEVGDRGQALAMHGDVGMQDDPIRTANGAEAVVLPLHPGDDAAVIEAEHELHVHGHFAADSLDDADQHRGVGAERHEIDDIDRAAIGFVARFEHQRLAPIASPRRPALGGGSKLPAAVLGCAEQGGEAGVGIEARHAKPIDRAVAADQCRRLVVADQGVILDFRRHRRSAPSWQDSIRTGISGGATDYTPRSAIFDPRRSARFRGSAKKARRGPLSGPRRACKKFRRYLLSHFGYYHRL